MLARALDRLVNRPWLVLLAVVVLTLPALQRLVDFDNRSLRLDIDPSIEALLPRDGADLELLERVRRLFGSDDVLLVAWLDAELFTPEHLAALKRLTRRLERMPGIEQVDSLATALNVQVTADSTAIEPVLRELPADREAAARVRDQVLANPLMAGRLVAKDGRGALLAIHFVPTLTPHSQAELTQQIATASREEAQGMRQFLSGPLLVRLEIGRILLRDLYRVMPLAVLGTLLVAAIGFRNARGVLLPLCANAVALCVTLACFVAAGHALNFITVILPPVVYVVGFAYAIHIVTEFEHQYVEGCTRADAARAALREVFMPLALTAFTTAVGFASLATSGIESIRTFGIYATGGTLLAWITALLIVPAGLAHFAGRQRPPSQVDRLTRLAPALAGFDLRHRRLLLSLGAALALVAVLCASRIQISTDYLGNFPPDSELRRDFDAIGTAFAGAVPLQILIASDIRDGFKDPAQLRVLIELKAWLLAQPEIGGVYTLADYIGILHRAFVPEAGTHARIPATAALTDNLLLLGGSDDVHRFVDARYASTLLHIQSTAAASADLVELAARIEARLQQLPAHLRGHVTGSALVVARTLDDISRSQATSLGGALCVIYIVLIVLFGSARVAALALLPNALPTLVYFGILGTTGVTLNLTTSLVASVVLGIAIDDTIHFLSRFNMEARRTADEHSGMTAALRTVIRPATFITAGLCVGFMALTAGELRNQVEFGVLSAVTLFIAWLLGLTFTPALATRLHFVTLWDILAVDLGAAPQATIPLFAGLSQRQARIAALMGSIKAYPSGERIMAFDEPGHAMCVVIDGQLQASLPRDGSDEPLRTLGRGDLVGEVGVFVGKRSANVDALSPVRVLWLTDACLERMRTRYPRIGTQVYHNLACIMAGRLADLTKRV